jgi:hypothetical protein
LELVADEVIAGNEQRDDQALSDPDHCVSSHSMSSNWAGIAGFLVHDFSITQAYWKRAYSWVIKAREMFVGCMACIRLCAAKMPFLSMRTGVARFL